jgi:hypothetical protein
MYKLAEAQLRHLCHKETLPPTLKLVKGAEE